RVGSSGRDGHCARCTRPEDRHHDDPGQGHPAAGAGLFDHDAAQEACPHAPVGYAVSGLYDVADWAGPSMGGMLAVAVAADPAALRTAREAAERVGRRVNAWAS